MGTLFLVAILSLADLFSLSRTQRIVQIPPPRPLCAAQYVLANYACSRLPMFTPSSIPPPMPPPPPDQHYHVHDHDDGNDNDHDHDKDHDHNHNHNQDNHDHHDHNHDNHDHHDHVHDNDTDHDQNHDKHDHHDQNHDNHDHNHEKHDHHDHNHESDHHKRRRHHHQHHHHRDIEAETDAQKECCKWLKQMDNECVCELLVRLPQLLARPAHGYTVFVDDSCIVTFTCEGRLIP